MPSPRLAQRLKVADRVHSSAIHLLRRVRKEDPDEEISSARLSALSVVVFAGPIHLGALARAEQVRAPTMVRIVHALEASKLVRRRQDPKDRRAVRIEATPRGRRLMERARRARLSRFASLLKRCSSKELGVLEQAASILEACLRSERKT